jgi:hypothetical protein
MSRECRQRAGLTLSQASRHLRVTPKYLARCERRPDGISSRIGIIAILLSATCSRKGR